MDNFLSVVIVTCNRRKELLKAMQSCIKHTKRFIEFVIVDNHSTDNTKSAVESFCKSLGAASLNYIYLEKNTGVSYARNVGYKAAKGDILFFIDDDAEVTSAGNSLDDVYDFMRSCRKVMACTGVSHDYRYGGKLSFVRDRMDTRVDKYAIRSYVGFNHFIKKGFTDRDYIYPNNLFYGSEELYVGLSVQKNHGMVAFYSDHSVKHNPSSSTRIDRREGIMNGHINTYVVKKYFLPNMWEIASTVLFLIRIIRFCKGNLREIRKCAKLAEDRYDKQYDNKLTLKETVTLIRKFGFLKVL